jgi:hypothetical protein
VKVIYNDYLKRKGTYKMAYTQTTQSIIRELKRERLAEAKEQTKIDLILTRTARENFEYNIRKGSK